MIQVDLPHRGYDIHVGSGILSECGSLLRTVLPSSRVVIVSDENVADLYLSTVLKSLEEAGITCLTQVIVPAGESAKSFANFEKCAERILPHNIDRSVCLIALGGGVVGDLAGYLAASLLRGIPFVQIPTSLLAQVDSSVGGKTGINTHAGKNLIGAFHQPLVVITDTDVLKTLPHRELLAGYAEIVKYGLIDRPDFFEWLEKHGQDVIDGDATAQRYAIELSCHAKADIVKQDEKEQGVRALLNLGHTFGHALEAEAGYNGTLLHGEGVAIGMVMAFDLSHRLGLCDDVDVKRVRQHLMDMGLPVAPDFACQTEDLINHMAKDKKNKDGHLRFILVRGIGRAFQADDVDVQYVEECLQNYV